MTTDSGWPQAPKRSTGRGWKYLAIVVGLLLVVSVVVNLVLLLFTLILGASGAGRMEGPSRRVEAEVMHEGRGEKIAIVPVSGAVDESMVEDMLAFCEYVKKDNSIKGVVLQIDSPGGGITASDEIHHMFEDLKGGGSRRVVVSMRSLAASGGYYISMPADKIYAERTTLTGSIGVIWPAFEITGMMEKVGVNSEFIKSDVANDYKDAGSPFKKFTEKDRAYIKGLVNNAQQKFTDVVDKGRAGKLKVPLDQVTVGKIWPADEALDKGLIDEIAYLDEVVEKTSSDLGMTDPTVIRLKKRAGLFEALGAAAPAGTPKVEVTVDRKALEEAVMPRMEYRVPRLQ